MSSLKEIRGRINSVTSTLKITDVTRMISGAKLHKAQNVLGFFMSYKKKITGVFFDYLAAEPDLYVPLAEERKTVRNVSIMAFASNSSLCGAFNMNAIKKTTELICEYQGKDSITVYAVGRKMYDAITVLKPTFKNMTVKGPYFELTDAPAYAKMSVIADELIKSFLLQNTDMVHVVYNKFKNILVQNVMEERLLPLPVSRTEGKTAQTQTDYIIEPDKATLISALAPQTVRLALFEKLLQSVAAEHAARSAAMQAATDNAQDLISELSIQYNKVRQAAITKEILDIVGGAEALRA